MKRKLAFLMASVMACGTMMMSNVTTAWAAYGDKLTISEQKTLIDSTMYVEETTTGAAKVMGSVDGYDYNQIDEAVDLVIPLSKMYATVELKLTDAEWFFRNQETSLTVNATEEAILTSAAITVTEGATATTVDLPKANWGLYENKDISEFIANYDFSEGLYFADGENRGTYVNYGKEGVPYALKVTSSDTAELTVLKNNLASNPGYVVVPLVVKADGDADAKVHVGGNTSETGTKIFAKATEGNVTVKAAKVITSDQDFSGINLTIKENANGVIKAGELVIEAPSGFIFRNTDKVNVTFNGLELPEETSTADINVYTNDDKDKLSIDLSDITRAGTGKAAIYIEGISLRADSDVASGTDVELNLYSSSDSKNEVIGGSATVVVGKVADEGLTVKVDGKVPTLISGQFEDSATDKLHQSAKVHFSEDLSGSLDNKVSFELSNEAKIRAIKISNAKNVNQSINGTYKLNGGESDYVTVKDNKVTLNVDSKDDGKAASFDIYFYLSIEPGFKGDVTADVMYGKKSMIGEELVIAKAERPVEVATTVTYKDTTNTQAQIETADIVITEIEAGILEENETIELSFKDSEMKFVDMNASNVEVVKGGLKIKKAATTQRGSFVLTIGNVSKSKEPAQIKINDVKVQASAGVSGVKNLIVGGTAVAANYMDEDTAEYLGLVGTFDVEGQEIPYVSYDLAPVVITVGSNEIKVGDETVEIDVAPFNDEGTVLAPVRGVAEAFGFEASFYDDYADTHGNVKDLVTLTKDGKTIQFVIGESMMLINNVPFQITDVNGKPVNAMIKDGRTFIPMRALAKALNVGVTWDQDDSTVTFDASQKYTAN